jgi:hypothetical protein
MNSATQNLEVIISSTRSNWSKTYYSGTSYSAAQGTYAEIAMSLLIGQEVRLLADGKVHLAATKRAA